MPGTTLRRVLPFRPEQLFDLVAEVERYPEFVPWWVAARITGRDGDTYATDQVVRFGPLRRRFATRTQLLHPARIVVTSEDRGFRQFQICWRFDDAPKGGCEVGLTMTVELSWRPAQEALAAAMGRAPERLVAAFEARARQIHGITG